MEKVLTIAGSDSGGGAGIQADLKTLAAFGVYGASAITAVTAQNSQAVKEIFPLPARLVAAQINSAMEELKVSVWKTGMLFSGQIVKTVAELADRYKIKNLVIDPVIKSTSGTALLKQNGIVALKKLLLPLAFIVTPNIHEAEALTGLKITTIADMKQAAVVLHKIGVANVVIKGGHLLNNNSAVDVLFGGKKFYELGSPFVKIKNAHGTGCTFASCIAAEIAKGKTVLEAVRSAKEYIVKLLKGSSW